MTIITSLFFICGCDMDIDLSGILGEPVSTNSIIQNDTFYIVKVWPYTLVKETDTTVIISVKAYYKSPEFNYREGFVTISINSEDTCVADDMVDSYNLMSNGGQSARVVNVHVKDWGDNARCTFFAEARLYKDTAKTKMIASDRWYFTLK